MYTAQVVSSSEERKEKGKEKQALAGVGCMCDDKYCVMLSGSVLVGQVSVHKWMLTPALLCSQNRKRHLMTIKTK